MIFADDAWSAPTVALPRKRGPEGADASAGTASFLELKRVEHERYRQRAEIAAGGDVHEIDLPLAGDFQIGNALVAAGLAIATGTEAARRWRRWRR